MPFQFIKQLLPLPSFFTLSMPSEEEPAVFPATVGPYEAPCPVCEGKTVRHAQTLRRFRHGYAWHVGLIWIELQVPRHRCIECDLTFTHDFGLDLIQSPSALFRKELVQRCTSWIAFTSSNFSRMPCAEDAAI